MVVEFVGVREITLGLRLNASSCDAAECEENAMDLVALALDAPLEEWQLDDDFGEGEFCDRSTGTEGSPDDCWGRGA